MRQIIAIPFLLLLGACANKDLPILANSICSPDPNAKTVFKDPGFAVRGATRKDQAWVSGTQEAGIRACGWKRPPARAKVVKASVPAAITPVAKPDVWQDAKPTPAPPKKPSVYQRIKQKFKKKTE